MIICICTLRFVPNTPTRIPCILSTPYSMQLCCVQLLYATKLHRVWWEVSCCMLPVCTHACACCTLVIRYQLYRVNVYTVGCAALMMAQKGRNSTTSWHCLQLPAIISIIIYNIIPSAWPHIYAECAMAVNVAAAQGVHQVFRAYY